MASETMTCNCPIVARYNHETGDYEMQEHTRECDTRPAPEYAGLVERLNDYRSRNEFGDPVHHSICDEAAATIARLTAENARQAAEIERLRATSKPLLEVCYRLDAIEELPWQIDGSMLDEMSAALELNYPVIWTPEQVEMLKERQANPMMHPYTCGGDRSDAAHRQITEEDGEEAGLLYPTVRGWKCPACDYRQFWSHETGGPDAARALTGGQP